MIEVSYESYFVKSVGYNVITTLLKLLFLFHERNSITILLANKELETELSNGIKLYKDDEVVQRLTQLVIKYPTIWKSLRFIQVPLERSIKVHLKPK